jgi:transcriptional regulator with XRE-family HTH domain
MSTGDTPAVARRRVRLALREARRSRHLTQTQVAEAMEWSLSKVMRIEKGDVNVSVSDLRALLTHLGVTDAEEVDRLLDDARTARGRRGSVDARFRTQLTPALVQLMEYEQQASAIRYYSPVLVPGILQTKEYATAIFEASSVILPSETVALRMEARLQRKQNVLLGEDQLDYLVILDESVLYRQVGGPHVLADQLRELIHFVDTIGIKVRILPFTAATTYGLLGPFLIVDMGDDQDPVLYREGPKADEIVNIRREIAEHRETFERLWGLAYGDRESADLMRDRIGRLLTEASSVEPSG